MMVSTLQEATVRRQIGLDSIEIEGEDGAPQQLCMDIEATVEFQGTLVGAVVLRCTTEGAQDIARSFLMLEEGDPLEEDEMADALGECANMVAGTLKTKGLDPHGEFQLGIPQLKKNETPPVGRHRGVLAYRLTQGVIALEIWLDD